MQKFAVERILQTAASDQAFKRVANGLVRDHFVNTNIDHGQSRRDPRYGVGNIRYGVAGLNQVVRLFRRKHTLLCGSFS